MSFTGYFPWYWIANQPVTTTTAGTIYTAGQCTDKTQSNYLPPGIYYVVSRNTVEPITQIGGCWFAVSSTPNQITDIVNVVGNCKVSSVPVSSIGLELYTATPPLTQVTVQNGSGATNTVFSVFYKYI